MSGIKEDRNQFETVRWRVMVGSYPLDPEISGACGADYFDNIWISCDVSAAGENFWVLDQFRGPNYAAAKRRINHRPPASIADRPRRILVGRGEGVETRGGRNSGGRNFFETRQAREGSNAKHKFSYHPP